MVMRSRILFKILLRIKIQSPDGGGGEMSSKNVDPPGKILGTHLLSGSLQGEGGGGAHDRNLA
jgi:hypothetical protein